MTAPATDNHSPEVWLDLSDLVDWHGAPTGIQRVVIEYGRRLANRSDLSVQGCAFRPDLNEFVVADITKTIAARSSSRLSAAGAPDQSQELGTRLRSVFATIERRSPRVAAVARRIRNAAKRSAGVPSPSEPSPIRSPFRRGDHVVVLGANWLLPGYAAHLSELQRTLDLRVTHMVHDVIPTAHPQWAATGASTIVTPYLQTVMRTCATIIAVSESTRADVERLANTGVLPKNPNGRLLTLTHGHEPLAARGSANPPAGIDPDEPFIVCVGTIEIRKNHIVLYQAYREAERDGIQLPRLFLVGRSGWLAEATEHLITNDPVTRERITMLQDLTDDNLAWLYEHCLFTVFPSVYEGWGLPVAESLGYGKVCLTTDCAALPEVGGDAADYLSPYDARAWLNAIDRYFCNPRERLQREQVISEQFKLRTWDEAAEELVSIITGHDGPATERPDSAAH